MIRDNKRKIKSLYQVWLTSLLLGYFAYIQPLNTLLDKIRETGIISVSLNSVIENKEVVTAAILPSLLFWLLLCIIWLLAMIIGTRLIARKEWKTVCRLIEDQRVLDGLFYIGMIIEMVWAAFFYATFHMPLATVLVFIAMQCFAVRILLSEYTKKEWIWVGCLVFLGIACEFYTTRGFVLRAVLLLVASKGMSLKKIMKYYLAVNAVSCGIIIFISYLGFAGTWIEYDAYRALEETQNRYVLGFNSPNTTHYVLIRLALVAMYIWWEQMKAWQIAGIFVMNYALYMITDSRTGMLVGFIGCVLAVFFKYFKKMRDWKIWYYLAVFMIVVLTVFSLHFLQWDFYQYDTLRECPGYVYRVNDMMVGRIHQAIKFTQDIEVSPFGTRRSGVYCDMGYIKFFLQEGFLIYGIYLLAITKLILWQHKTRDYAGYIIVVAVSTRMLMESSFVPFVFQNVILLLFVGNGMNLIKTERKKGNEV